LLPFCFSRYLSLPVSEQAGNSLDSLDELHFELWGAFHRLLGQCDLVYDSLLKPHRMNCMSHVLELLDWAPPVHDMLLNLNIKLDSYERCNVENARKWGKPKMTLDEHFCYDPTSKWTRVGYCRGIGHQLYNTYRHKTVRTYNVIREFVECALSKFAFIRSEEVLKGLRQSVWDIFFQMGMTVVALCKAHLRTMPRSLPPRRPPPSPCKRCGRDPIKKKPKCGGCGRYERPKGRRC